MLKAGKVMAAKRKKTAVAPAVCGAASGVLGPASEGLAALLPAPPVCPRRPRSITHHNDTREDPYFWLRDAKTNPAVAKEVKKHLKEENVYADAFHDVATNNLRAQLYSEMKKRWKETDTSLPSKDKDFWYYGRVADGMDHPVFCRLPFAGHENLLYDYADALSVDPDANIAPFPGEQVLVDMNEVATKERMPNAEMGDFDISPNQQKMLFTLDLTNGSEEYTIVVADISMRASASPSAAVLGRRAAAKKVKGKPLEASSSNSNSSSAREIKRVDAFTNGAEVVWGTDDVFFYFILDETKRACGLVRHKLSAAGTDDDPFDKLLFEEEDPTFSLTGLSKTDDEHFLVFYSEGKTSTEARFIAVSECSDGTWKVLRARRPHVEYSLGHHPSLFPVLGSEGVSWQPCWVVVNNEGGAENFKAELQSSADVEAKQCFPFIRYDPDIKIESVELCAEFVLVTIRHNAVTEVLWQTTAELRDMLGAAAAADANATTSSAAAPSQMQRPFAGLSVLRDFRSIKDLFVAAWQAGLVDRRGGRSVAASSAGYKNNNIERERERESGGNEDCYFIHSHFDADASENFTSTKFRVSVGSFIVPTQEFEVDLRQVTDFMAKDCEQRLASGAAMVLDGACPSGVAPRLLKVDPVRGHYDPQDYGVQLIWAETTETAPALPSSVAAACDTEGGDTYIPAVIKGDERGVVRIPVTLAFRRDRLDRGSNPLVLYAYGSYGESTDPEYHSERLSLLDRGVIVAIAAVRGGGELGRLWRNSGRMEHRINSITDFLACARAVVEHRWCAPGMVIARGGSAGGTVVAAAANMEPHLFAAVSAAVPFVDCLSTLLDPALPLTTAEWSEFGDPLHHEAFYHLIKRYSPMDNVPLRPCACYPSWYIETGWSDPRVPFWECAAFATRLRHRAMSFGVERREGQEGAASDAECDGNAGKWFVVQHCNLAAGHGGAAGRYESLKELAREYAFILWAAKRHTEAVLPKAKVRRSSSAGGKARKQKKADKSSSPNRSHSSSSSSSSISSGAGSGAL